MGELKNVAAGLAGAAWCVGPGAQELLREPESEPLFAYSTRPLEEQARRQSSGPDAFAKPLAQGLMSVEVDDRHLEIWSLRRQRSGVPDSMGSGTISDLDIPLAPDSNRYRRS
jgi:hypothetical protein